MSDKEEKKEITVSAELIERLVSRIEILETRLEKWEEKTVTEPDDKGKKKKGKKSQDKTTTQKVADSLSDRTSDIIKDSGRMVGSLVDASAEVFKQSANVLADLDDETDKEKLGEIPAAFVSIFRKVIDIQKKVIDKFEESYEKYGED